MFFGAELYVSAFENIRFGVGKRKIKPIFLGKRSFVFLILSTTLKCRFFSVSLKLDLPNNQIRMKK